MSVADRASKACLALALAAVCELVARPATAGAQQPMSGFAVDTESNPLSGVEVTIAGTNFVAVSDDRGAFRFPRTPPPPFVVRARRIGFTSMSAEVSERQRIGPLTLVMRPAAQTLPSVNILPERVVHTGRLAEYYTRLERRAGGVFITREDIDRGSARNLSVLLERVPGLQLMRGRVGSTILRFRGRSCRPLVWFDGVPMPSAEVDINSFPPTSLHGIELYFGLSTVPARYIGLRDSATCGTILLWSRGPDTEFRPEAIANPQELERHVRRLGAFTAETVDTAARVDDDRALNVPYPPALFAERRRGRVVAEFVVNPDGRVEPHTIGIVSSTHPLFTQAVRATLQVAAFLPAMKGGERVFQLVHQAFDFDPVRRGKNE